jgi:hypothetical protein
MYTKISDLDISKLTVTTKNPLLRRNTKILYNGAPLKLILPKLKIPFSVCVSRTSSAGAIGDVSLSLGDNQELIDKLKELDNAIISIVNNSSSDLVAKTAVYTYTVTDPKSDEFTPVIKTKISIKDYEVDTLFFDQNKELIAISSYEQVGQLLTKGTNVFCVLECYGLIVDNNRHDYRLSWKLEQIRIIPDDSDDEKRKRYAFGNTDDYDSCDDINLLKI